MFDTALNQTVTYWGPSGSDVYGGTTFTAPSTRLARWEDKSEIIRNKAGAEYVTKSRVFMKNDFDLNGYLFLGSSSEADPRTVIGAYEIQQRAMTPDLKALKNLFTAYL